MLFIQNMMRSLITIYECFEQDENPVATRLVVCGNIEHGQTSTATEGQRPNNEQIIICEVVQVPCMVCVEVGRRFVCLPFLIVNYYIHYCFKTFFLQPVFGPSTVYFIQPYVDIVLRNSGKVCKIFNFDENFSSNPSYLCFAVYIWKGPLYSVSRYPNIANIHNSNPSKVLYVLYEF